MSILEFLGYLGSILIVGSALMKSIANLRWMNLAGSIIVFIYSIIIKAYPVALSNLVIGGIHFYQLIKIYNDKVNFEVLNISSDDVYVKNFLQFQKNEILKYFPEFDFNLSNDLLKFCILRDTNISGVFIGKRIDNESIFISLDFVAPQYRDFKVGKYIYINNTNILKNMGVKTIKTFSYNKNHEKYLKKMGFVRETLQNNEQAIFAKTL